MPTEMDRIISLPVIPERTDEERFAVREHFRGQTITLRDIQCDSLLSLLEYGCLFGPIGVGYGKTLITLLAGKVLGNKRNMILVPPEVCNQLVKRDIPMMEREFGIRLNFCSLYRMSPDERAIVRFESFDTIIFPYSLLSVPDTYDLLDRSSASLVCADECHMLRNRDSARTKRLMTFLGGNPQIRFVCLSGTITKRSIFDYRHLIKRCLNEKCPLPDAYSILNEWNGFLGVRQQEEHMDYLTDNEINSFLPLRRWYEEHFGGAGKHNRQDYRKIFRARLATAPGVVQTSGQSVDASLRINNLWTEGKYPIPREVQSRLNDADRTWTTPSGDELEDAMHLAALKAQLCSGFYYRLEWPSGTPTWVLDQHDLHNELKSQMRSWLRRGPRRGADTPLLVYNALKRRDAMVKTLQESYDEWQEAVHGRPIPKRLQFTEWIDHWKVQMAIDWLEQNDGIIWYMWDAMGEAIYESLHKMKCHAEYCPAGVDIERLEQPKIIASINAHSTGKNLQIHHKQLVLEVPRSGSIWEQMLGRTHRMGQQEDTVYVDVACGTEFERDRLGLAFLDARYIENTGGGKQKMLIADFEEPILEEEYNGKVFSDPDAAH